MIVAVTAGTQRERKWRLAGPVARMMQADNKKFPRSPACMSDGAMPRSSRGHGAALGGRGFQRWLNPNLAAPASSSYWAGSL